MFKLWCERGINIATSFSGPLPWGSQGKGPGNEVVNVEMKDQLNLRVFTKNRSI